MATSGAAAAAASRPRAWRSTPGRLVLQVPFQSPSASGDPNLQLVVHCKSPPLPLSPLPDMVPAYVSCLARCCMRRHYLLTIGCNTLAATAHVVLHALVTAVIAWGAFNCTLHMQAQGRRAHTARGCGVLGSPPVPRVQCQPFQPALQAPEGPV